MPLLLKEPFARVVLPDDIDSDDEVFYSSVTKEAFKDYESFFERAILCSSMVWSCSVTRRTGLTFAEAMESEQNANSLLNAFPESLQLPVLYLVTYIRDHKLPNLVNKITAFITNRYFVGEDVDVIVNDRKVRGVVRGVISPDLSKSVDAKKSISYGTDPSLFSYEIECPAIKNLKVVVGSQRVTRAKGMISKDKLRLFLKQHLEAEKRFDDLKLKKSTVDRFNIRQIKWTDIFAGPTPNFESETVIVKTFSKDKVKPVRNSRKNKPASSDEKPSGKDGRRATGKQRTAKDHSKGEEKKKKKALPPPPSPPKASIDEFDLEEKIRQRDELRQQKLEQKLREKERVREEKRKREEYMLQWNKKRDDFECDDLVPLPAATVVECGIPSALFGDALMLLEFFHNYGHAFDMKDVFPAGITLEVIEKILSEDDLQGPLLDITRILLNTIFSLQDEENRVPYSVANSSSDDESEKEDNQKDDVLRSAVRSANATSLCVRQNHGVHLSDLEITPFSITEVLRLHILSSGAGKKTKNLKGWTTAAEDPCFWLRIEHPTIVENLSVRTIFDLNPTERLVLLKALVHQILSSTTFRDYVDDGLEKVGVYNKRIKELHHAFWKWDRENCVKKVAVKKQEDDNSQENVPQVTDEQVEEYRQKKSRKQEELTKKVQSLKWKIKMAQGSYRIRPVGQDRLYRKYWIFPSIGGLFVDNEDNRSALWSKMHDLAANSRCAVYLYDLKNDILKPDRKSYSLSSEEQTANSDKENECSAKYSGKIPKSALCSKTIAALSTERRNSWGGDTRKEGSAEAKWSFYYTTQQIESLIGSLNSRGFRESELKDYLTAQKTQLLESLTKCPVQYLNKSCDSVGRKSQRLMDHLHRKAFSSNYSNLKPCLAVDKAFRDYLLELEERLYNSRVVCLDKREEWRKNISPVEGPENHEHNVRNLAKALLVLGRSIYRPNLGTPLNDESGTFERWQESLAFCSSMSQLFLYLNSLEKSIIWPKSCAGVKSCRICLKKADFEWMVYCHQCGRGHHTFCLQPPLSKIPADKWYCFECKPKYVPISPRKAKAAHVNYNESSDDGEIEKDVGDPDYEDSDDVNSIANSDASNFADPQEEEKVCEVCTKTGCDISCSECSRNFHLACQETKTVRPTRRRWKCLRCDSDNLEEYEPRPKRKKVPPKQLCEESDAEHADSQKDGPTRERKTPELVRQTRIRSLPLDYKKCGDLLIKLARHEDSKYFHKVPKNKDAPKYSKIIKRHTDFGRIISKLNMGAYSSNSEFFEDVYLILKNCELFWPKQSEQYRAGKRLGVVLHELMVENGFDPKAFIKFH